ncbi:MSMEG_1061 family FMN-dependent PPOX-type flavoprotein [Thetidibacter halocola]|uniref:Pyridoxamine 5'-phosphate oxidase family protein n=1 Tax=Thetidibacter halocola TaxID=2827239 RepID=A0A8J8B9P0_9RHOB|nr:MSMEG_1061 family FMN-dependent PPOX-type flavoprotein [Thetidibacter halocola]MBS0126049.1 pyridoxamine 5'-phosphate oxidase family protein [Thetidibacter halocola]
MRRIETLDDLHAHYGEPVPLALTKVARHLTPAYRRWIEQARFCILSTAGPEGVHGSPRGDVEPVVRVVSDTRLLMPDWQGNNRLDCLRDIVTDGRAALLFLVPGTKTTVRVNGRAWLTDDAALRESFQRKGRHPATVIVFELAAVYTQCAKALMRPALWEGDQSAGLPTIGEILAEMTDGAEGGADYDIGYEDRAIPRLW